MHARGALVLHTTPLHASLSFASLVAPSRVRPSVSRSFSSTASHVVVWPPLSFFIFLLASCSASFAGASSGSLIIQDILGPQIYMDSGHMIL